MSQALFVQAEEQEDQQDPYEGFEIKDDMMAEWAVQKIKEAQSDTLFWKNHYDSQLAKIKKANDSTVAAMTGFLAHYFGKVPHQTAKTQARYELPSATLIRKQQNPEYKYENDELVAYFDAAGHEDYVKVKREPKWGEFKKNATAKGNALIDNETGEIVKCVTVATRPDTFDVKIKEA